MEPFTGLKAGTVEFSNRLIMAPVKTAFGTSKGEVTDRHEAYYHRRAEGNVGAIIVEPLYIDLKGKEHPKQLGIADDNQLEGLKRLTRTIHEGGALAIAHINHAGRAANPKVSGTEPEAPSEVTCQLTGATPVAMTEERIKQVVLEYADSARRALEAGFDAVEIQFGLGYLISQFLSPRTNLRNDRYGGSRENRYRFAAEVLDAVAGEGGGRINVIARISASEQVQGGTTIDDAIALAGLLEEKGVAALHVASGSVCDSPPWYFQHMRMPLGKNLEWAGAIKKEVGLPVIAAGRLGNPRDIRTALENGVVDAVALGRPLIADPDLPLKMRENRDEDVLQCGACLQGCLAKVRSGEGMSCIINPEVGRESDHFSKSAEPKTVVIVGGGPGGMQAALTSSQRGHKVILFEGENLGGKFNLCHLPPGKQMMKYALTSFVNQVRKGDIDIRDSTQATVQDISAEHPDVVILATGARPVIPPIPGMQDPLTGEDVLTGRKKIGKRVLIIGGGMVGLETAEFLVSNGHQVTVVVRSVVGRDMLPITKKLTLKCLAESDVRILTDTKISRFVGKQAFAVSDGREQVLGEFDSVVVAAGTKSVNELEPLLRREGLEVTLIGDAKKPRQIYDAVRDGYETGISI